MERQSMGWLFMVSGKDEIVRKRVEFGDRFKDDKLYYDDEKEIGRAHV